jgi:nitrate reductase alpha subunit
MNATRNDTDELLTALDTLGKALDRERDLAAQIKTLRAEEHRHGEAVYQARLRAAKALKCAGGVVVVGGRSWRVDERDHVSWETVQLNLDAVKEVRAHNDTPLRLTPSASEKAA